MPYFFKLLIIRNNCFFQKKKIFQSCHWFNPKNFAIRNFFNPLIFKSQFNSYQTYITIRKVQNYDNSMSLHYSIQHFISWMLNQQDFVESYSVLYLVVKKIFEKSTVQKMVKKISINNSTLNF